MSPRVVPPGPIPTPQTPSTPLAQPGKRARFISKRPVMIKNTAGEEIDIFKLRTEKHEDGPAPTQAKEEATRRPTSVILETEDAWRKRLEEEKLRNPERAKKVDELVKIKAKRDAEAKERAKRDQEEKDRHKHG
jgi:hypothetical protein